ncbi:MAG: hypothetical protein ACRD9R_20415, partial [Pyrinomonadaceae bacterium]
MDSEHRKRLVEPLIWGVIALGVTAWAVSLWHLQFEQLNYRFWFLALVTVGLGSRLKVKIPQVKSEVTVSETFVFLTMLLFDGEAAVLVAGVDAFCTSLRFSRKPRHHFFNGAMMAGTYFLTATLLRLCFGPITLLPEYANSATLIFVICVMSLAQYASNSGLVALTVALRSGQPFWHTWRHNYLYTSLTYIAGASAAALIAKMTDM